MTFLALAAAAVFSFTLLLAVLASLAASSPLRGQARPPAPSLSPLSPAPTVIFPLAEESGLFPDESSGAFGRQAPLSSPSPKALVEYLRRELEMVRITHTNRVDEFFIDVQVYWLRPTWSEYLRITNKYSVAPPPPPPWWSEYNIDGHSGRLIWTSPNRY